MTDLTETNINKPSKLSYQQIVEDLSSIPINQNDVLFNLYDSTSNTKIEKDTADDYSAKLEKLLLFKANLEQENQKIVSELSLDNLNQEIETIDNRLNSLQHFIDISEKFLSINK
jgi:hypothetical protein